MFICPSFFYYEINNYDCQWHNDLTFGYLIQWLDMIIG